MNGEQYGEQLKKDKNSNIFWFMKFVRPYKYLWIIGNIFYAYSGGFSQLLMATGLENVIDGMMDKNYGGLKIAMLYILGAGVCVMVCEGIYYLLHIRAMAGIKASLKGSLFHKYLRRKISFNKETHTGEYVTTLEQDSELGLNILGDEISGLVSAILLLIVTIIAIASKDILLGGISCVSLVCSFSIHLYFTRKQQEQGKKKQEALGKLNRVYSDTISGAMVIRLGNLHEFMTRRIHEHTNHIYDVNKGQRILSLCERIISYIFEMFHPVLPLLYGAYQCYLGQMTIGEVFFLVQLGGAMIAYSNALSESFIRISSNMAAVERMKQVFDDKDEVEYFGEDEADIGKDEVIKIENLTFAYEKGKVIKNINLTIQKNNMVAIVGKSGSGKSTLFKCILQLLDYEGDIKLYEKNTKNYALSSLRDMFSYVEQEARLFDGTIYDNIEYGRDGATEDEVIMAAKEAYANDFILKLPKGYDTIIGENGYKLSGGERQRVAIARALLKDAPILLLDEATSALDSESEKMVQMAIEKLMKGKTIIVIAHRLSTIQNADQILVLEDGVIIEEGTHESLIAFGGRYEKLYRSRRYRVASSNM